MVVNLDLPQRDIVTFERLPTIARVRRVLVDADLDRSDLRASARGR